MKINFTVKLFLFSLLIYNFSSSYGQTVEENKPSKHYDLVKFVSDAFSDLKNSHQLIGAVQRNNATLLDELDAIFDRGIHSDLIQNLVSNETSQCSRDIEYLFEQAWAKETWAFSMIDSSGKPGSGILQGNVKWVGNYDECIQVYAPPKPKGNRGNFHGKYCTYQINVNLLEKPLPFSIGVCIPDSCKESDFKSDKEEGLNQEVEALLSESGYFPDLGKVLSNGTITNCLTAAPKKIGNAAIGVLFVVSLAAFLALVGSSITAYEYFAKRHADNFSESFPPIGESDNRGDEDPILGREENKILPAWIQTCKPFFDCFCVFTNGEKLLNTTNVEGQMLCLHGIRFFSMTWVIVCHTYMFCFTYVKNAREALPLIDTWPFQVILNGWYSVDSFFLLSGFLLAYLFLQQSSKGNGKIPWLYFYVHRYLRLTPVYMIILGIVTAVYPIMGSGPFWTTNDIDPLCSKTWWMNLLYINNFQNNKDMCMAWSWYLANDMQFFVISPLFLIPLVSLPVTSFSIMAVFCCANFVSNFAITYYFELPSGLNLAKLAGGNTNALGKWGDYMDKIYQKPYTRIGPYLVGIALAYHLYQHKKRNGRKNSFALLSIGWIIASGVTLACQFGLYHRDFSLLEASFYNTFSRTCYGCGLGWVIYVCLTGQAKFINSILSFRPLIPLSRLTYCAYLIHPLVQMVYFGNLRDSFDFSHITMVLTFLGLLMVSYATAFLTSLLFESPIIQLEKIVRKKFSRT